MTKMAFRAGAIFYALWAILHIYAASQSFTLSGTVDDPVIASKLSQNGWNLAFISIIVLGVSLLMNWRNSWVGYWVNLTVVSVTDLAFVIFMLIPGISTDLPGPILWIAGAICSTLGIMKAPRTP